jgi:hypothetical protein
MLSNRIVADGPPIVWAIGKAYLEGDLTCNVVHVLIMYNIVRSLRTCWNTVETATVT